MRACTREAAFVFTHTVNGVCVCVSASVNITESLVRSYPS